jgi:hypothetical protein
MLFYYICNKGLVDNSGDGSEEEEAAPADPEASVRARASVDLRHRQMNGDDGQGTSSAANEPHLNCCIKASGKQYNKREDIQLAHTIVKVFNS